jgi:hypothetical protein
VLKGPKGDEGDDGAPGADGRTILHGADAPEDTEGDDGDFYLQTDDPAGPRLFGPKAAGQWPGPGIVLKGPKGDPGEKGDKGATILSGAGDPNLLGDPPVGAGAGDFFFDSSAGSLYGPYEPTAEPPQLPWGEGASLKGPKGDPGEKGDGAGGKLYGVVAPGSSAGGTPTLIPTTTIGGLTPTVTRANTNNNGTYRFVFAGKDMTACVWAVTLLDPNNPNSARVTALSTASGDTTVDINPNSTSLDGSDRIHLQAFCAS